MNISKMTPDDPRLTAYALGELEPAEMAAIEAAIKDDPAAQAVVEQVRALSGELTAVFATEPLPAVKAAVVVAQPLAKKTTVPSVRDEYEERRKVVRFPYFIAAGLAAACFAVMFVYQQRVVSKRVEIAKIERRQMEVKRAAIERELRETEKAKEESASRNSSLYMEVALNEAEHMISMPTPSLVANYEAPPSAPEMAPPAVLGQLAGKDFNTESYAYQADNAYLAATDNPLSTFSIDVDTASYSNMRRFLKGGKRPPRDAVRIEELVNYFPYRYAEPKEAATPFAASMEVASAPWNPAHRLVRIGLKGREVPLADRPNLNLVFLLDVSGSMNERNKLPLVKESMRLLVEKLKPTDRVAIAVYAGASGLALPSTPASKKMEILAALDALQPSGSTNGALGIQLAYDIAKANFVEGGANRVVLCTDGDFNVGVTNEGDLTRLVEEKAKTGVFLTVLGFGMGNYKDANLEKLADKGNGNYGYVDNASEAKKLLVEQLSGTLVTIAKDVKLQVEFNPAVVKSYRLIGYENRMLKKEDFNNDKIDAGEIGAGHTVTALYEVVPVGVGAAIDLPTVDPLRYRGKNLPKAPKAAVAKSDVSAEMLTLKVRFKAPTSDVSNKLEFPLVDSGAEFAAASQDFKFAAAVASFGMMLRESPHKGAVTYESVLGWAEEGLGADAGGYRHEFMDLVKQARGLSG